MLKHYAFLKNRFEYISPIDFYRELFPIGSLQEQGVYHDGKCNAIAIEIQPKKESKDVVVRRYTVTDGLEELRSLIWKFQRDKSKNFCIVSPISYIGLERKSSNARFMYALVIEIDDLIEEEDSGIKSLIKQTCEWNNYLPKPTFIACSGSGVHLYYQFNTPLPLWSNVVDGLTKLKRQLTDKMWNKEVSISYTPERIQYESIFQAFRMVGTATKAGDECSVFRVGEPVDIDYMNKFVAPENRVSINYKSAMTKEAAKEKFPEWYERRVIRGEGRGHWTCKRDLYDWWKREIVNKAVVGHRYYCMMCLSIYARKSGIEIKELESDCFDIMEQFELLTKDDNNHFTEKDVIDALQIYEDDIFTYPINSIANRSGIAIEKNRRNYRKQDIHLKRIRAAQSIDYPNGEWRNKAGAPTKQKVIQEWRAARSSGTKYECAKDLGIDIKTVSKWWDVS